MKNKKIFVIILSALFIILSLLIYKKAQSAFPKYLQKNSEGKLISIPVKHLYSGSKNTSSKPAWCSGYLDLKCASGPCGDSSATWPYCPPGVRDGGPKAGVGSYKILDSKGVDEFIVTNHEYYFHYVLGYIFGFSQYNYQIITSNTSFFQLPRVVSFLQNSNVKKSSNVNWCNGAIKIEKALLGYAQSKNRDGSVAVQYSTPAVYFYVSRYIYPIDKKDKDKKCVNFGLPMDIAEPQLSKEEIKKYGLGPNTFYYFLDISEYPN